MAGSYIYRADDALLARCEDEPIRVPGAIQPHGVLIAIDCQTERLEWVSANVDQLIGHRAEDVLGRNFGETFGVGQSIAELFEVSRKSFYAGQSERLPVELSGVFSGAEVELHKAPSGQLVVECGREMADQSDASAYDLGPADHLQLDLTRSPAAGDISPVFDRVVRCIRKITGYDRVMIYKLDEDYHGEVCAEAVRGDREPFLGLHFPASDIPKQARELYLENRCRLLADVCYEPVPLICSSPHQGQPIDLSLSNLRSFSPVHIEYLENMGVAATFVLSIVVDGSLWGLVACHHYSPKNLPLAVRQRCSTISQSLSLLIEAHEARRELKASVAGQSIHRGMERNLLSGFTWEEAFGREVESSLREMKATGFVLYCGGVELSSGRVPSEHFIKKLARSIDRFDNHELWSSNSLVEAGYGEIEELKEFCGCLCYCVSKDSEVFLFWFRPEEPTSVSWAGDPRKSVIPTEDGGRLSPRKSFEKWVQQKQGRAAAWTAEQRFMARALGVVVSRRKIEEVGRLKSQFLANMSHEIRTPMGVILGYIDELNEATDDWQSFNASVAFMIDAIRRNGAHLLDLINDVLDLSKIESGRFSVEQTSVGFDTLLTDVCKLIHGKASGKGIACDCVVISTVPAVMITDPLRIRQILLNLLGNAVKFTERGGIKLEISGEPIEESTRKATSGKGWRLKFRVSDTGCGIPAERIGHLFNAFTQAEGSTSRLYGGTGLGLDISRRLARLLGGDLILEQTHLGVGSVFSATILVVQEAGGGIREAGELSFNVPAAPPPMKVQANRLDNRRILVVEDGIDNRRLLRVILSSVGCHVVEVEHGLAAIEAYREAIEEEHPFDAILMDMQMPVCDGYEATRRLRAMGAELPIIAVTAHALSGERQRCIDAGCSDYLSKPVDREKLYRAIEAGIGVATD